MSIPSVIHAIRFDFFFFFEKSNIQDQIFIQSIIIMVHGKAGRFFT